MSNKDIEFGRVGCEMVADFLLRDNILKSIHLYQNNIDDDGISLIAKSLETNKKLKSLNIGMNRLKKKIKIKIKNKINKKLFTELVIVCSF